jgi:hypothetical protein
MTRTQAAIVVCERDADLSSAPMPSNERPSTPVSSAELERLRSAMVKTVPGEQPQLLPTGFVGSLGQCTVGEPSPEKALGVEVTACDAVL